LDKKKPTRKEKLKNQRLAGQVQRSKNESHEYTQHSHTHKHTFHQSATTHVYIFHVFPLFLVWDRRRFQNMANRRRDGYEATVRLKEVSELTSFGIDVSQNN
jgi:hypothetical protein